MFNGDKFKTRKEAFEAARKQGLASFNWKGNDYNTMRAGETEEQWARNVLRGRGNTVAGSKAQGRVNWKGLDAIIDEKTGKVTKVNGGGFKIVSSKGELVKGGFKTQAEADAYRKKNHITGLIKNEQKQTSMAYSDQSAKASGPTIIIGKGTNRGLATTRKTNNNGTNITIGEVDTTENLPEVSVNASAPTKPSIVNKINMNGKSFIRGMLDMRNYLGQDPSKTGYFLKGNDIYRRLLLGGKYIDSKVGFVRNGEQYYDEGIYGRDKFNQFNAKTRNDYVMTYDEYANDLLGAGRNSFVGNDSTFGPGKNRPKTPLEMPSFKEMRTIYKPKWHMSTHFKKFN